MDPVTPMNNNLKRETSVKSPGVRRIHADIRELHLNKSRFVYCLLFLFIFIFNVIIVIIDIFVYSFIFFKIRNYAAKPCEDDLYDWHFVIRGPEGTDFDGGRYHGRIILPPDVSFCFI